MAQPYARATPGNVAFSLAVAVIITMWAFPFVWMVLGSLKPTPLIISTDLVVWFTPSFEHYRHIFATQPFARYLLNSTLVALATTLLTMVAGTLTAYSLSRFRTGGRLFEFWILFTRMLPPVVLLIPLFLFFRTLGLLNTLTALIIANTTFLLSFVIWVMRSFFEEVSESLEEAAMIDGATRIQSLRLIVLPLARPGLITTTILTFIFSWNEYLFAIVFATASTAKTLPVAAADFITGYAINWGPIFASGTLIVLPVFALSILLQRYIVRGLTVGAVKG